MDRMCLWMEQPGEVDLIRVASVKLTTQLQARLLQQEEVNPIQDMDYSSGHDDGRYCPLYGLGEMLGRPSTRHSPYLQSATTVSDQVKI